MGLVFVKSDCLFELIIFKFINNENISFTIRSISVLVGIPNRPHSISTDGILRWKASYEQYKLGFFSRSSETLKIIE